MFKPKFFMFLKEHDRATFMADDMAGITVGCGVSVGVTLSGASIFDEGFFHGVFCAEEP